MIRVDKSSNGSCYRQTFRFPGGESQSPPPGLALDILLSTPYAVREYSVCLASVRPVMALALVGKSCADGPSRMGS